MDPAILALLHIFRFCGLDLFLLVTATEQAFQQPKQSGDDNQQYNQASYKHKYVGQVVLPGEQIQSLWLIV